MIIQTNLKTILAALMLACLAAAAIADTADDGRKIVQANEDAVVNVLVALESVSTYQGESERQERKSSVTATVIDASGLAVASLMETDPSVMDSQFQGDDEPGFKMTTNVVDVKIKISDGTEVPADIVLRDRDLDLVLVKPKTAPEKPWKYVDLSQGSSPQLLDELVILSRLGQVANRSVAVTIDRVRAVVSKPRTFYVVTPNLHSGLGGPAFTLNGKPAGILVMRVSTGSASGLRFSSGLDDMMTAVVLPASTVLKTAQQAGKGDAKD